MIDIDENPIIFISMLFLIIIGFIAISFLTIQYLNLNFVNDIPINVFVKDNLIFTGINGCVRVNSGGDTTTIKTYDGFLCLFPKETYTDRNIRIEVIK